MKVIVSTLLLLIAVNASAQTIIQHDLSYGSAAIRKYDSYSAVSGCPDPESMPIVVLIHGGGWVAGDKAADGIQLTLAPALAAQCFIAVVPNYTLASGVAGTHFPAALVDLKTLLSCFAELMCAPGGDPHRISIVGVSAGAHYAYLMGLTDKTAFTGFTDHVSTDYTIRAVIGNSTPTDLSALYTASVAARPNVTALLGYVPSTNPSAALAASPAGYLRPTSLHLLLQSGSIDTLVPPTAQSAPFAIAFSKVTPPVIVPHTSFAGYWHADPKCGIVTDPCFTEAVNFIVTYGQ